MDQMSQFLLTAQDLSQNIQKMNGVIYIIIILKYSKIF